MGCYCDKISTLAGQTESCADGIVTHMPSKKALVFFSDDMVPGSQSSILLRPRCRSPLRKDGRRKILLHKAYKRETWLCNVPADPSEGDQINSPFRPCISAQRVGRRSSRSEHHWFLSNGSTLTPGLTLSFHIKSLIYPDYANEVFIYCFYQNKALLKMCVMFGP